MKEEAGILELSFQMGETLLKNGAEISRVQETMERVASAYQVEKQTEVGVAGASALGQMGASSGVELGGASGFNPVSMMAGMAVGSAVGQNLAGVMNQAMAQHTQPPLVPAVSYHVAVNGHAAGPFDLSMLTQMAANGQLNAVSLVWKPGMAQWQPAGSLEDLRNLFGQVPPPVPTGK